MKEQSTVRRKWEKARAQKEEGGSRPELWKRIVGEGQSTKRERCEKARALEENSGRRPEH
jgi:hypothetical protein